MTAIANRDCAIDLYVFGSRRASAPHFTAVRCDRLLLGEHPEQRAGGFELRISDPESLALVGNSTVGTKLSGKLSSALMRTDVEVGSRFFRSNGRHVYSHRGALTIASNIALPLAAFAWLLVGASQGGWKVDERWIFRWRWRSLAAAVGLGLAVFILLPKVEIESQRLGPTDAAESGAWQSVQEPWR